MEIVDTKYFNRELSWLRFNSRVLNEARRAELPLLDKLKFLAIYGTNLDEFYMIRVAGLKRLYASGITKVGADKLTALEQLNAIREYIHSEKTEVAKLFGEIKTALDKQGLKIKNLDELNKTQKIALHDYFINYLYPIIVPIVVDSTHPFPHLNNLSFGIVIELKNNETKEIKYGIIRIPRVLKRFVEIDKGVFVPVESIVGEFASELFLGHSVEHYIPFRVTRNADFEIEEDEADDFMQLMSESLRARKRGEITRLEVGEGKKELKDFVQKQVDIPLEDIYSYNILLNLGTLWELVGAKDFAHLGSAPFVPKSLPPIDSESNILGTIESQDIVMFHPYESFDPVVDFIKTAAKDPNVLSIRMTLYRVGKNSPIVKALIQAAEDKQVTVLVELKARFDEENNLHWARALESAGAHVIYGVPGLKVHAKIALVIKKVGDKLTEYVHLSTGNYNTASAKIYTDISLLTINKDIGNDAIKFFHSLSTGSSYKSKLQTLFTAPTQIKPKILELIKAESSFGKEGRIILKANALVDTDVIDALYVASKAGVQIDLIIRGVCCLRPNVKGLSENIRVFSIIGKYLEHARIYYFAHSKEKVFFASADLMPRNLERRVELLTPATNKTIADKLIEIVNIQLSDNVQIHQLQSDGEYKKIPTPKENPISSQVVYERFVNEASKSVKKESAQNTKAKKLLQRMVGES
ncbi:RNA degradosome polyphosphate kinase [Helicobacter sp. T3_23-1059]